MNANELAEQIEKHAQLLDNLTDFPKGVCDIKEAAKMLRQQADRIAELEKVIQEGMKAFGEIQDQRLKDKFETPQTKPLSKPEECKDGCPELQVCDYCQQTKPLEKIMLSTQHGQGENKLMPVAWMSPDGKVSQTEGRLFYIPLYTTPQTKPAPEGLIDPKSYYIGYKNGKKATKPLSDEEIVELIPVDPPIDGAICGSVKGLLVFARAIEERHGIK